MKLADVVIQHKFEEFRGGSKPDEITSIRIVPLEVENVATEAPFVPLHNPISVGEKVTALSILPVQQLYDQTKQPNFAPAQGFEFELEKFSRVAVVELTTKIRVSSQDHFTSIPETFEQEVVLVPFNANATELPLGAKFVGLLECEGYSVSAQDEETGQTYALGFFFAQSAERIDWLELAETRRKHWIRAPKDDVETPAPKHSSFSFTVPAGDDELAAAIGAKFGKGQKRPDGRVVFNLWDSEQRERCEKIQNELIAKRRANAKGWLPLTRTVGPASSEPAQDVDVADYEPGE